MVSFGPCVSPPPLPGQGVFEIRSRSQGVVYRTRFSCVRSRGHFLLPNAMFPTLRGVHLVVYYLVIDAGSSVVPGEEIQGLYW